MKSKRAGVFIASLGLQSDSLLSRIKFDAPQFIRPSNEDLVKLVELAEADARERAVRAFKSTCGFYDDGRNSCYRNPIDPQRKCDCRCGSMENFQNAYDND